MNCTETTNPQGAFFFVERLDPGKTDEARIKIIRFSAGLEPTYKQKNPFNKYRK